MNDNLKYGRRPTHSATNSHLEIQICEAAKKRPLKGNLIVRRFGAVCDCTGFPNHASFQSHFIAFTLCCKYVVKFFPTHITPNNTPWFINHKCFLLTRVFFFWVKISFCSFWQDLLFYCCNVFIGDADLNSCETRSQKTAIALISLARSIYSTFSTSRAR